MSSSITVRLLHQKKIYKSISMPVLKTYTYGVIQEGEKERSEDNGPN